MEPPGCTGLLSLGGMDNLPPKAGIWDLQVPRSPGGASLEAAHLLRMCGQHRVSVKAAQWHRFASPWLLFYLLRSREMGRQEPGSAPGTLAGTSGSCRYSCLGRFPPGAPLTLHSMPGLVP